MPDILHRVGIKSTPKKVFKALSTIDGLSRWWVVGTNANAKQGGTNTNAETILTFGSAPPHPALSPCLPAGRHLGEGKSSDRHIII